MVFKRVNLKKNKTGDGLVSPFLLGLILLLIVVAIYFMIVNKIPDQVDATVKSVTSCSGFLPNIKGACMSSFECDQLSSKGWQINQLGKDSCNAQQVCCSLVDKTAYYQPGSLYVRINDVDREIKTKMTQFLVDKGDNVGIYYYPKKGDEKVELVVKQKDALVVDGGTLLSGELTELLPTTNYDELMILGFNYRPTKSNGITYTDQDMTLTITRTVKTMTISGRQVTIPVSPDDPNGKAQKTILKFPRPIVLQTD